MILKIKMNYFNFLTKKMLELCSRYLLINILFIYLILYKITNSLLLYVISFGKL